MNETYLRDFINHLVWAKRRERFLEMLEKPAKYADRMYELLRDTRYFEPSAILEIPSRQQHSQFVFQEMQRLGAGQKCYILSTDDEQDGQIKNLRESLEQLVGTQAETLLYCWIGKVAYFEGHEGFRVLLKSR